MNTKQREQHWSGILCEQSESGLSKQAFCASRQINAATFYYWQRRLQDKEESVSAGFQQLKPLVGHELSVYSGMSDPLIPGV
jgi:hypothetical protein